MTRKSSPPVLEVKLSQRLQKALQQAADASGRTLNAEISYLLRQSLYTKPNKAADSNKLHQEQVVNKPTKTKAKPKARRGKRKEGIFSGLREIIVDEISTLKR